MANDQPSDRFAVRLCTSTGRVADGWGFPVSVCNKAAENTGCLNTPKIQPNVLQRALGLVNLLCWLTSYRDQQLQRLIDVKVVQGQFV